MHITVVCTDKTHPVFPHLQRWCASHSTIHKIVLVDSLDGLLGGDLMLLISCSRIVDLSIRSIYRHTLVIHASDLPEGRGWSPMIWQLLEGRSDIAVTLLTAEDQLDSGNIWAKRWLHFDGHELVDEINEALFQVELELMNFAVENLEQIQPQPQASHGATWYPRRMPSDSRLDPNKSIADQFDILRVADPERYPAFFDFRGHRYEVTIRKKTKNG